MFFHKYQNTILSLKLMYAPYRWQIVFLTFLGLLRGLLDGVGVTALIPAFAFIVKDEAYSSNFITQFIETFFNSLHITFRLKYLLLFIVLVFLIKFIVVVAVGIITARITAGFEERTRKKLWQMILSAQWLFLMKQKIGVFENVLMNDVRYARALLERFGNVIILITNMVVYLLVALNISFYIALYAIIFGGLLSIILKPFFRISKNAGYETSQYNKFIANQVNESIAGIKSIKAAHAGQPIVIAVSKYFEHLKKLTVRLYLLKKIIVAVLQPVSLVFIIAVFGFYYHKPDFNIAAFAVVVFLVEKIFNYLGQLQTDFHIMTESVPYINNIVDSINTTAQHEERETGNYDGKFTKEIRFSQVNFLYDAKKQALTNINFSINRGEMVGLIGPSGGGKTTVVDLVLRLLEPTKGKITIDGIDLSTIKVKSWRQKIAYVSQDFFLLNGTIIDNVRFFDENISEAEVIEACKMANIYDFLKDSPGGMLTMVGERGCQLSAGQRQRIVLARALARKPDILILDEATSGLDNESESKICQMLDSMRGKMTILIVAHRLNAVVNCDKLLTLENGVVVEEGRPSELLRDKNSYFYRAYHMKSNEKI